VLIARAWWPPRCSRDLGFAGIAYEIQLIIFEPQTIKADTSNPLHRSGYSPYTPTGLVHQALIAMLALN
jgi:hypothetical protein